MTATFIGAICVLSALILMWVTAINAESLVGKEAKPQAYWLVGGVGLMAGLMLWAGVVLLVQP